MREIINNLLTLSAIPFFFLGIIVALMMAVLTTDYNIFENYISDLGSINHTPFPYILNGVFIISSILFMVFYRALYKLVSVKYPIHVHITKIALMMFYLSGIGLLGIGIFNEDSIFIFHEIFAIMAFGFMFLGEIIIGMIIMCYKRNYLQSLIISTIYLTLSIILIINLSPFAEWMFLLILIAWGFPLIYEVYKKEMGIFVLLWIKNEVIEE